LPSIRIAIARVWRRSLRDWRKLRAPQLLVAAGFTLIVGMYCTNRDMGGDPVSPRGDGVYRPVLARGDGHMLYLMARSTALDGDWVFDNDLARFGDPWHEPRTATGRKSIVHNVGPALVWTPLIWIAQAGAAIANALGAEIPMHGYTLWHQRFVFLFSALFACCSVLLGLIVARRFVGGRWAPYYAAICVLLGTSLTYYATYMPSYSHAMDAFACAAFLAYWSLSIGTCETRRWIRLGILLGIAMLIRTQEVAMGAVVAVEIGAQVVTSLRSRELGVALRWTLGGLLTLAVAVLVFVPQLLEWHWVFGRIGELPQGARYTRWEAPMIAELLFSSRNGWFCTTPVAYLGVIGLFFLPSRTRLVGVGLLTAVAIQVYLNSTIFDWWGGAAFGQRRLCSVTLPLVVGLAALIWRLGAWTGRINRLPGAVWHILFLLVAGALLSWNLYKVHQLRSGKAAPSELSPSCCHSVPLPVRGTVAWWYQKIGNPFQFPANLIFSARHDVDIRRWDQIVGSYPFVPPWNALRDDQLARHRATWRIGSPGVEPFLVRGFSGPLKADRPFRWTTEPRAIVLVPNLMPYGQRLVLWVAPGGARKVTVRFNDEVVATQDVSGWTGISFDLPAIPLHTNELEIESVPALHTPAGPWPVPTTPVGVAVGELEFSFCNRSRGGAQERWS